FESLPLAGPGPLEQARGFHRIWLCMVHARVHCAASLYTLTWKMAARLTEKSWHGCNCERENWELQQKMLSCRPSGLSQAVNSSSGIPYFCSRERERNLLRTFLGLGETWNWPRAVASGDDWRDGGDISPE